MLLLIALAIIVLVGLGFGFAQFAGGTVSTLSPKWMSGVKGPQFKSDTRRIFVCGRCGNKFDSA